MEDGRFLTGIRKFDKSKELNRKFLSPFRKYKNMGMLPS